MTDKDLPTPDPDASVRQLQLAVDVMRGYIDLMAQLADLARELPSAPPGRPPAPPA